MISCFGLISFWNCRRPFPLKTAKGMQKAELNTKLFCNWCGPIRGPVTPNKTMQNLTACVVWFLLKYIQNHIFSNTARLSLASCNLQPPIWPPIFIIYAHPNHTPRTQRNPTEPKRGFCSNPSQGLRTLPEPNPTSFMVPVEIYTKPICVEALPACLVQLRFTDPGRCT